MPYEKAMQAVSNTIFGNTSQDQTPAKATLMSDPSTHKKQEPQ